ncbi:transketolase-like TK C-terminal-containing protein [Mycolicibacter senuensis]|uniref:transketolase-like TK C-terminal-containing protein n=1 Tax=Mycolicibacter senuensis TaxID=386913 RepID=UPI000A14C19E|nr:pyruvate dehydrogenase [Mycolicibacter senuensis]ORW69498.1 pyruvate dehydrogenase [Mycolicibacter senuensis]
MSIGALPCVDVGASSPPTEVLTEIEHRVLWLSTAMIHHANRVRPNPSGLKVGGHQASSSSMVSIMTSLWFGQLRSGDRVSVKPHASPVLHAINYLIGELDEEHLTTLRQFGGLQSYPSRSKDPDPVDYSTGSVGIGATAPIWGALSRRYVHSRFSDSDGLVGMDRSSGSALGRQYSLVGDAELDEGAVWEAILDPAVAELGELVWIVDMNRQSLDRVVPLMAAERLERMFGGAGWQVITCRFGRLLESLFLRSGGAALRARILSMPNPEYQRLLRHSADQLRGRLPGDGEGSAEIRRLVTELDDATLLAAIRDLGGHDLEVLREAYRQIDDTRPTVIIAYTIKGYGLPTHGHPQNHSSLLTVDEYQELATGMRMDPDRPWRRFDHSSAAGRLCAATRERLRRPRIAESAPPPVPTDFGHTPAGMMATQAALGRALLDLSRQAVDVAERVVTVSPDVSSTTNLAGWLNKVGIWSPTERRDWFDDDGESLVRWRERPTGQHMQLGIAETNLVGLIGELGATWSRWRQPLFPIGVLYDPFVERALEPWSFGIYAGGQSILVGTPSGVTLAAEGGAHQSIKTPSIGIEQPNCVGYEPAFAVDVEWILLSCLARLGRPGGSSSYLRLSTRPVPQKLAGIPGDPGARDRRRRQVIAGAYVLRRAIRPAVTLVGMGAIVPELLNAGERLGRQGIDADIVCVTSPGLLFEAMQARRGLGEARSWIIDQVFPADRAAPMVTALDGHPHTLAFLTGINQVAGVALGVSRFGQAGALDDVYRYHEIDADSIVRAALDLTG